jgi:hypothetical protein
MNVFDTMADDLSRIYLHHVCDPDAGECWNNAILFEFTGPAHHKYTYTQMGHGIRYCPRCLRSFHFPAWNIDYIVDDDIRMLKEETSLELSRPSYTGHICQYVPDKQLCKPQEAALDWYAAIFPEFYADLFATYPEAFPLWLHPRLPRWLESMQYFVRVNLGRSMFLHPSLHFVPFKWENEYTIPSREHREKKKSSMIRPVDVCKVYTPLFYPPCRVEEE